VGTAEAERRQTILAAAERLLRHYGPGKTTIAEIAREADVGVGTVYLEFSSKDAILEALSAGTTTRSSPPCARRPAPGACATPRASARCSTLAASSCCAWPTAEPQRAIWCTAAAPA
jgi:hypothetical protein